MKSHHLVLPWIHPFQAFRPVNIVISSVIPAVWCAFPCHLQPSQTASACINRSLTIRLWSAAYHRECHYDSARSQKKKGHGRTPGRLPGCTYRLSRFSEGTFQNVLWLLKSNDLAWCKKFVILFCIFIIFSFTFVNPFTYSVLGELKADMILKNYEKVLFLYL